MQFRYVMLGIATAALIAGCPAPGALPGAPGGAATATAKPPATGTAISNDNIAQFGDWFKQFLPTYKVGQKWAYTLTIKGLPTGDQVQESSREVTKIEGTKVTLTTNEGKTETETQGSLEDKDGSKQVFTYAGDEDVTVPAGSYKGCAKFTSKQKVEGMGEMPMTLWLAKGNASLVKLEGKGKVSDVDVSFTQELKSFTDK